MGSRICVLPGENCGDAVCVPEEVFFHSNVILLVPGLLSHSSFEGVSASTLCLDRLEGLAGSGLPVLASPFAERANWIHCGGGAVRGPRSFSQRNPLEESD